MKKIALTLCLFLMVIGCRTYTVDDEYLKYLVYRGNEILYFRSSNSDYDSIILHTPQKLAYEDEDLLNFNMYEQIDIGEDHSDPDLSDSSHADGYGSTDFAGLFVNDDGETYFYVNMRAKDAEFDPFWGVPMDTFINYKTSQLSVPCGTFSDVIILEPKKVAIDYESNSNYITKVYWSKSYGLLRYDKKDSYWELDSTSYRRTRF